MKIMVELDSEDLSYFSTFEKITGVIPVDYLNTDSMLLFLVDAVDLGRAIGRKGVNMERLRSALRKKVVIISDSNDLEIFVRQFFSNISIFSIEIMNVMGENTVVLMIDEKDRGIAIGKNGERIKAAKELLKKKFSATIHLKTRRVI